MIDSREKGRLLDPSDYPTKGPEKARKDGRRKARSRPMTGGRKKEGRGRGSANPQPAPSGETPRCLEFYKEAEEMESFQYIGAMFKKNAEVTHDALAIHLHNKVRSLGLRVRTLSAWGFLSRSVQMSSRTINSWKRYCLHHRETIEDLRRRAINNAGERAIPRDQEMADATAPGADTSVHISPQAISQQADPQRSGSQQGDRQANPQQADSQHPAPEQPILQSTTPQQAVPRQTAIQQTILQHVTQLAVPQQAAPRATVDQDQTAQPAIFQQDNPASAGFGNDCCLFVFVYTGVRAPPSNRVETSSF